MRCSSPTDSTTKRPPTVSVLIATFNGRSWLEHCLLSLRNQTYRSFEVIVVDNGSTDDTLPMLQARFPEVRCVALESNTGYATANNIGARHARGEFLLLLNNDTKAEPHYLERFVEAFDRIQNLGAAQSLLVQMTNPLLLDTCGSFWTSSTLLYHYGNGKDSRIRKYTHAFPVFSIKGASMLIRRDLVDRIGLFDDDFWCYYEDTDLCHRVWLTGYECWYYPIATLEHAVGGTSQCFDNAFIQYHNFKNKLLSILCNFEARSLVRILPLHIALVVCLGVVWLGIGRTAAALAVYRSLWWNMRNLPGTLRKREAIQSHRRTPDSEIIRKVRRNPRVRYYPALLTGLHRYAD